VRLRVTDVEHLKRVIDQIRRGSSRSGAKITTSKTLIVLGSSARSATGS
jgi:hypothetical protein